MSGGLTRPLSDAEKAQLRAPIAEWLQRAEIEDSDSSLVEYAVILAATPRYCSFSPVFPNFPARSCFSCGCFASDLKVS
jgi:hypothetical protein